MNRFKTDHLLQKLTFGVVNAMSSAVSSRMRDVFARMLGVQALRLIVS